MTLRLFVSLCLCVTLALQAQTVAFAGSEQVVEVNPVVRDGKLYIDADVDLDVTGDLRNVAQKGVPIYFTADLRIVATRWWWFDKVLVDEQLTWRVVYNALTRQWRIGAGELSLPESSLDNALSLIRNIRGWGVADIDKLEPGQEYYGRIRVRLDTSLLARPFQIDALNSSAWSLETPWKDFSFSVSADSRDPS
ncbi:MAG TPA: DUF4390 domain-containing protein [Eoetvoesiella sp.]